MPGAFRYELVSEHVTVKCRRWLIFPMLVTLPLNLNLV